MIQSLTSPRFGLTIVLTGPKAERVSERAQTVYHRRGVTNHVVEPTTYGGQPAVKIQTPTPAAERFEKPHTSEWMGVLAAFTKTIPAKRQHKPIVAFMDALTQDTPPADGTYVLNCPA